VRGPVSEKYILKQMNRYQVRKYNSGNSTKQEGDENPPFQLDPGQIGQNKIEGDPDDPLGNPPE
jgi:hypothetical protein